MHFFSWLGPNENSSAGWALTLLSEDNISYAATCQTLGLNTGIFASFTVFLALNSVAFSSVQFLTMFLVHLTDLGHSEKWGIPRLTLSAYLQFWSVMCFAVTFWLLFFKKEVICLSLINLSDYLTF